MNYKNKIILGLFILIHICISAIILRVAITALMMLGSGLFLLFVSLSTKGFSVISLGIFMTIGTVCGIFMEYSLFKDSIISPTRYYKKYKL